MEQGQRITVVVRKRPLGKKELAKGDQDIVEVRDVATVVVKEIKQKVDLTKYVEEHNFNFDLAFDQNINNEQLYAMTVRPIIEAAFNRAKVTCFAYGQTGSGKTYTMIGDSDSGVPGLYVLASHDIFCLLNQPQFKNLHITISFYEIYCNKLQDLLNDKNQLQAREDAKGNVNIVGLSEKKITNVQQLMQIIEQGQSVRVTSSNSANNESSRSHALLQINLKQGKHLHGKLSFIDLAGSERGADVQEQNKQTRIDGAEINKSLLALKECIRAIDLNKNHTPFRGSKLTLVLKDSFTGNCRTVMIGNISPSNASSEHTLNTLRYADRVKELKKPSEGGQLSQQEQLSRELMLARQNNNVVKKAYKHPDDESDDEDDYSSNQMKYNQQGHQGLMKQFSGPQQNENSNLNPQNGMNQNYPQQNPQQTTQLNNQRNSLQQNMLPTQFKPPVNQLQNAKRGSQQINNPAQLNFNQTNQGGVLGNQQNNQNQSKKVQPNNNQQQYNMANQQGQNNDFVQNQYGQNQQYNNPQYQMQYNQQQFNQHQNQNQNLNQNQNQNNFNQQQQYNPQLKGQLNQSNQQQQNFNANNQMGYQNNNNKQVFNNFQQPNQFYNNFNQPQQQMNNNNIQLQQLNHIQQQNQYNYMNGGGNPQMHTQLSQQSLQMQAQANPVLTKYPSFPLSQPNLDQQNSKSNSLVDEGFPDDLIQQPQHNSFSQSSGSEQQDFNTVPQLENFIDYNRPPIKTPAQVQKEQDLQKLSLQHEQLVQQILQEEDLVINAHREQIDKIVAVTQSEMQLLKKVEQPSSDVQTYVAQLNLMLDDKLRHIHMLKSVLNQFTTHLQEEETLSKLFYEQRQNMMQVFDIQQQDDMQLLDNLEHFNDQY